MGKIMIDTMTQLYEEDDSLSIADRTISLRYHQFRTPRKELKQLILDNKKTYLLSEAEKQKYEKCLNGNVASNGNMPNFKDDIHVDIEGFSIEIAKKFGINYLMNKCILVSTKQIECDSMRDSYHGKYNKQQNAIIRKVFNIHRNTVEQILMGEALIGIVNQKDPIAMMDNPESLFSIEFIFDTPNNTISKLKKIRNDERTLLENEGKLKDREFLKNLLQNIDDISAIHGSLSRIPDKEIDIKEKVDFNKLRLNDMDIYCLKSADGTNIFVYFFADDKLLFSDDEIYMNDDLIILNGKDIESLNVLIELGLVGYSPYIGLERYANMILRNRKEERENVSHIEQKNLFYLDNDDNVPEKARGLLKAVESLVKNKRDKDFFTGLDNIKIYMTYPLIQNDILYELLTRMENNEYKSCYMDTEKFIKEVSNMDDDQLEEFVEKILDSLEFIEENNTMVNMWLMENRKNVCDDLGVYFANREI